MHLIKSFAVLHRRNGFQITSEDSDPIYSICDRDDDDGHGSDTSISDKNFYNTIKLSMTEYLQKMNETPASSSGQSSSLQNDSSFQSTSGHPQITRQIEVEESVESIDSEAVISRLQSYISIQSNPSATPMISDFLNLPDASPSMMLSRAVGTSAGNEVNSTQVTMDESISKAAIAQEVQSVLEITEEKLTETPNTSSRNTSSNKDKISKNKETDIEIQNKDINKTNKRIIESNPSVGVHPTVGISSETITEKDNSTGIEIIIHKPSQAEVSIKEECKAKTDVNLDTSRAVPNSKNMKRRNNIQSGSMKSNKRLNETKSNSDSEDSAYESPSAIQNRRDELFRSITRANTRANNAKALRLNKLDVIKSYKSTPRSLKTIDEIPSQENRLQPNLGPNRNSHLYNNTLYPIDLRTQGSNRSPRDSSSHQSSSRENNQKNEKRVNDLDIQNDKIKGIYNYYVYLYPYICKDRSLFQ